MVSFMNRNDRKAEHLLYRLSQRGVTAVTV